ncbi:MAG: hypothetical protein LBU16_02435 [Treponema sp.]|jgi:hypothetical protein|nr:hypothetical protein [Treponema sp.]
MSGVKKAKALSAALVILFLMNSCADFFSTTWGVKRDPNKVRVTDSNVYELLKVARGDPELSKAILNKINADSSDTQKRAAVKAANQAAGIPTLVLENVQELIKAADDEVKADTFIKMAENIRSDIKGITGTADKLAEILVENVESVGPLDDKKLVFTEGLLDGISDADKTLLVITLVLARVEEEIAKAEGDNFNVNKYIESWAGKDVSSGNELGDDEKIIIAAVNGMTESNELTKILKQLFFTRDGGTN